MLRCLPACLLVVMVCQGPPASGQPGQRDNPLSFDRNISGLLRKYCHRCHNADEPNGGVDLQSARDPRMIARDPLTWRNALEQLRDGTMPPDDARQPTDDERDLMAEFIEMTVSEFDCSAPRDPGTPTLRRLNRAEYNHAIRYLTGLDLRLADEFPEDTQSFGFRNIAQSLTLSPLQVEQYFDAARRAVDAVLDTAERDDSETARRHVFFVEPGEIAGADGGAAERQAAGEILRRFATRAFRRDVDDDFLGGLLSLYDRSRSRDVAYRQAVGHALVAILISPRFLMRTEQQRPDSDGPYPVEGFDLASRLSFFLWAGPPDDELLGAARQDRLGDPEELDRQVRRMLADPRSDALIEQFFAPWLQFDAAASHRPDGDAFPGFDERLKASVMDEPRHALRHLIRADRPITELIDADYIFADATLAAHYGISDVTGDTFRMVEAAGERRGGLLTTAALLMVQSDPGRTNVPRRGNFIAGAILGAAPPPPPPDVPELSEDDDIAATMTLRERFEAHRADPQCASCHARIDPLGFALENYDAVGRWRATEVGKPIDASGELPDGRSFDGPGGLKQALLQDREAFARVLSRQMLIYALGRGPMLGDDCVIDEAVAAAESDGYRFSAIVRAIVHSYPFLHTRNPEY